MKNSREKRYPTIRDEDGKPARGAGENRHWWTRLCSRYKNWRSFRDGRKAFRKLDDRQLRDIGLTRHDLPYRDDRQG